MSPARPRTGEVLDSIRALLHRWLASQTIQRIERAATGGSTEVYAVWTTDNPAPRWLRLAENAGEDRTVEVVVHERLRALGARIPAILHAEAAPPELDRSAALTGHIPGIPLRDCRDPATVYRVMEQALPDMAAIATIPVCGYGWIDRVNEITGEIMAVHAERAAWTAEYRAATERVLAAALIPPPLVATFTQVMDRWCDRPAADHATLAHGDLDGTHIMYDPATGTYTGIIDFGEGRGADPLYDIAHFLLQTGENGSIPVPEGRIAASYPGYDPIWMRRTAIAIAIRRLAIMLGRHQSPDPFLLTRLTAYLSDLA